MDDIKQAERNVETAAKKQARELDGHQPSDDVGNAGDEIRKDLGNAGDEIHKKLDSAGEEVRLPR